ncbi:snRNA-activating protein complex subunit 4 homolog [Apis florea]|uniref:snRNA-activating protein complex subunit 4 homolog n=1 Tax=Apis florea TaxID=7463 RepID=UPI0012FF5749|nr:snRNA-activating protein complex subunit 4 homolog [Apis florea]
MLSNEDNDDNDLVKILLLESIISFKCENEDQQIVSSLLDLKKHVTFALQKCERKLKAIEKNLQKHALGDTKILICNAGMPYFKDKYYFFAPNNEDEILKENSKELQLRNLPKVSSWTKKERDMLLKAIQKEAISDVLCIQKLEYIHSPLDCSVMWNVFLQPDINKSHWTKSEDIKLRKIVKKYKFQNWDKIAKELNTNRTAYQCFIRYNTTKKLPKIRNCTWENEEDERLLKLIEIFKVGDFIPWGDVASWMQNRTKQQAYSDGHTV